MSKRNTLLGLACLLAVSSVVAAPAPVDDLVAELGLETSAVASRELPGWRVPRKVVVPGTDPARLQALREALPGVEIVGAANEDEAVAAAAGADVVVGFCSEKVVAAAKDLRLLRGFT